MKVEEIKQNKNRIYIDEFIDILLQLYESNNQTTYTLLETIQKKPAEVIE